MISRNFHTPLVAEWQTLGRRQLGKADKALDGDSKDAEHNALFELREQLAELAGRSCQEGPTTTPMKITREQAEQVRPIVQRIAKARWELDAANELEAALGQYFSVTDGSEFLDGEEELTGEMVQQWVEGLKEED